MSRGDLAVRVRLRHPRLVVVTGAGSGIGRATALAFAEDGATVLVTDVDEASANQTVRLAVTRTGGASAFAYQLDVSDGAAWHSFAEQVAQMHGVPDVVVNNAGIAVAGPFVDQSTEDWERLLGVNLLGVIHGCRVFAQQMVDRGEGGHIVNVGSMNSFMPAPNLSSYAVAKAGVKMLSECLQVELAEHGIGVTVVMPGMINTNIVRDGTFIAPSGSSADLVDFGRAALERAFSVGWPPRRVGRAIVRAVRYNLAVVPVGPEAWAGYWLSRLSPQLLGRLTGQALSRERLEFARRFVPTSIKVRLTR